MRKEYSEYTLSNGLKVLLKEIHTAPLISSWIWYRVGSRDEPTGLTGISHWVEHMQFKGTPTFPTGVLDRAISRDGGFWNAFTYLDWTTYFETMPADKIDLALRLEADRMTASLFDENEVESERTVIISEREGSENEPLFLLGEAVQQAAFRVHPYHHEVIGDLADLRTIRREQLYQHYRTYYVPNNAVLALAGDFETQAMLARIRELFEPIPAAPPPPRLTRPEPEPTGEHHLTVEGPGETTYLQIAYRAPAGAHPDFFPLTIVDSLLAGPSNLNMFAGGGISNRTSRLYEALVQRELAVSVSGNLITTLDPFLYQFVITVHPKRTPDEVLQAFDAEISRIQEERVGEEEIRRAVKQAQALFAYGSESITNQAFWLGHAEMFADYSWFLTYLDNLARVTPEAIQQAAQTYLRPSRRVVGIYLPTGTKA
ncbi:MAG: insulinase family protein [Anaerolineales bacterium]|nr:insulinase family protein [Anaerolineales bacterium]MDW8226884.1 pitrilysin family protein [Anaerolineales bacterium]